MDPEEILIRLIRIETKIDTHLVDHQKKYDLFTRILIPCTAILSTVFSTIITHWFSGPKH